MKKTFNLLFIFLFLIFIGESFAKETSPSALVLKASGEIILNRDGNNKNVENGEILYSGDELISKDQSMAAIRFVDNGAIIKLFANSILTINTEKQAERLDKKLVLEVGDLLSKVTKERGEYQIQTPTSVAAVKGTNFHTNVQDDGETMVLTFDGIVELQTDRGVVEVSQGQTGIAKEDEAPVVGETTSEQISEEVEAEIESGEVKALEIKFKDENGEEKILKVYYKEVEE